MRRGSRAVAVVGVAAALALSGAREATAYVQFRTAAAGIAMTWRPACFPLTLAVHPGMFSQMTSAEIAAAVAAAAGAWSSAANACTFLSFQVQLVSGPAPRAARDGTNTIIFRDDSWCALDAVGVCNPDRLYDPAAPAMTTIYASATTGEIREADIEINAFHFKWADRVTHPELSDRYDLQNTLASQIGHLLGFDWACAANPAVRPIDHTGQPVVECASAPASLREATMYPAVLIDNIERRTLAADDQAAVCATYPAAATTCPADGGQACTCPAFSTGVDGGQDAAATLDAAVADAGTAPDAAAADRVTADAGDHSAGDGCACAAGHPSRGPSGAGLLLVWAALVAITRRRAPSRPSRIAESETGSPQTGSLILSCRGERQKIRRGIEVGIVDETGPLLGSDPRGPTPRLGPMEECL